MLRSAIRPLLVTLAALAFAAPAFAQSAVLVGDPTFQPEADPLARSSQALAGVFETRLSEATDCQVTSKGDLRSMVDFQKLQQTLGAETPVDAADGIIGALGADTLVAWSVGHIGETYVVSGAAFRDGKAIARANSRAGGQDEVLSAVQQMAADLGSSLHCPKPGTDFLVFEVNLTREEHTNDGTQALDAVGRFKRVDTIELTGLLRRAKGRMTMMQTERSTLIRPPHLSQCAAPGGYQDLPSKVDQFNYSSVSASNAATDPSVDFTVEGGTLQILGHVSDDTRYVWHDVQKSSGISCGKPLEPTNVTRDTDEVSVLINNANFDLAIPIDRSKSEQSGTKSWPLEVSGYKGTMKLTWRLSSVR